MIDKSVTVQIPAKKTHHKKVPKHVRVARSMYGSVRFLDRRRGAYYLLGEETVENYGGVRKVLDLFTSSEDAGIHDPVFVNQVWEVLEGECLIATGS